MIRLGKADPYIIRELAAKFDVHPNTIRADLHRWKRNRTETDAERRDAERLITSAQLEDLFEEVRDTAREIRKRAQESGDDMAAAQLYKAASAEHKVAEVVITRRTQLWGTAESDRLKAELLREKLLGGKTEAELQVLIDAEVKRALESVPLAELEAIVARRQEVRAEDVQ